MSTPARAYMRERAIDPRIAHELGVKLDGDYLLFPSGKRRRIQGEGPKFLNRKGQQMQLWWLQRASGWNTALVCEGESDALAAVTALRHSPPQAHLQDLPVVCVPGTGFPVDRLVKELDGMRTAFLAFDPDEAGFAYQDRAKWALVEAGIRPIALTDWMLAADLSAQFVEWGDDAGESFASALHDFEAEGPTLDQLQRERKAQWHEAQAAELRAAV